MSKVYLIPELPPLQDENVKNSNVVVASADSPVTRISESEVASPLNNGGCGLDILSLPEVEGPHNRRFSDQGPYSIETLIALEIGCRFPC